MTRYVMILWLVLAPALSGAYELVINPKAQATKDTCQSYQIAFGLVATEDPKFAASTSKQLRDLEKSFRDALKTVSANAPANRKGGTTNHENWRDAVATFTGGRYVLREEFLKTPRDVYERVAEKTGNKTIAAGGAVLAPFTATQPVFVSVNSVGPHTYANGHVVSVFGVNYPSNQSVKDDTKLPLVILNSAVKLGAAEGNMCSLTAGDGRYRAEVFMSSHYDLKQFGDLGYSLMWLERDKKVP